MEKFARRLLQTDKVAAGGKFLPDHGVRGGACHRSPTLPDSLAIGIKYFYSEIVSRRASQPQVELLRGMDHRSRTAHRRQRKRGHRGQGSVLLVLGSEESQREGAGNGSAESKTNLPAFKPAETAGGNKFRCGTQRLPHADGEFPNLFEANATGFADDQMFLDSLNCIFRQTIQGVKLQLIIRFM